ncbi:MAG: DUF1559 domain-containing protein, partial [Planctomycetaceae bacterium]
ECQAIAERNHECSRGFGSYHPGGSNFALADGSVRFVSETINMEILSAAASIAGRENVQLP